MVWIGNESVRKMWASVRKCFKILEMAENCQEMAREWSEMIWTGLKWAEIVPWSNIVQDDPRWFTMVQDGPRFQNGQRCLKHWKKYTLHTYCLSAKGAKAGGRKKKRSTILPISLVQSFFCVLFFSLCSNLSIWPGSQVVPDESRCYIPIFDGLVNLKLSWQGNSECCVNCIARPGRRLWCQVLGNKISQSLFMTIL